MWYLAEVLLAQPRSAARRMYFCESCNVVIQAETAIAAYRKSAAWGRTHQRNSCGLKFLGIAHLTTIGEELADGVEICGRFFEKRDIWARKGQLIPAPAELKAVQWERRRNVPIRKLLKGAPLRQFKRAVTAAAKTK